MTASIDNATSHLWCLLWWWQQCLPCQLAEDFICFLTVLHLLQKQKQHVLHHQQVAVVASCGGSLLVSMACMQVLKNYKKQSTIALMASMDNATSHLWCLLWQWQQCHPCHSAEDFIFFFDCFAFAPETNKTVQHCQQVAVVVTHGGSLLVSVKNNQPVHWWHWLMMQQVICSACCGNDSNATHVTLLNFSCFLWLFFVHLETKTTGAVLTTRPPAKMSVVMQCSCMQLISATL